MPHGFFRWRVSKPGFATAYTSQAGVDLRIRLEPETDAPPGMVRMRGGLFLTTVGTLGLLGPIEVPPFFIDRYEVTNKEFSRFVEASGYHKREYWKQAFVKDGRLLSFDEAVAEFRDATGMPGPAGWEAAISRWAG